MFCLKSMDCWKVHFLSSYFCNVVFQALFQSNSNLHSSHEEMGTYNTGSNCYFHHCVYNREANMVGCSLSDFERLNSENQQRKQQLKYNKFCLFTVLSCFSFILHQFHAQILKKKNIHSRARSRVHSIAFVPLTTYSDYSN